MDCLHNNRILLFIKNGTNQTMKKRYTFYSYLVLCSTLLQPLYAGDIELPDIGASSSIALTPHAEEQIGRKVATQIRNSHYIIDDIEINEYLQNVGYSLVANSDDAYQNFHFFLINSKQINAFATPGGVVAVYSGLFLTTETESELASVVGHEIAHVTQRHLARSFEKANKMSMPILAGMVAGVLVGAASGNGSIGAATAMGLSAASQQAQINYTRANEKEADRVGMRYLSRSGYDPSGMPGFFQKLERKNRYVGSDYPEFLRTHPITVNRIAEATQRAEQYKQTMKRFNNPLSYRLMKAKLTVLTANNTNKVTHYYHEKVKKNDLSIHPEYYYGYAQALFKQRSYKQAIKILIQLHQYAPQNTSYIVALAKAHIAIDTPTDIKKGLQLLSKTFQHSSYNLVIVMNYANALQKTGNIKKSIKILEAYHKDNFKHPAIYKLLSITLGKDKQLVNAHVAEANYYYLQGMLPSAIEQLDIAKRMASKNDFYTLSKIEAQKKAYKEEKELYSMKNK